MDGENICENFKETEKKKCPPVGKTESYSITGKLDYAHEKRAERDDDEAMGNHCNRERDLCGNTRRTMEKNSISNWIWVML